VGDLVGSLVGCSVGSGVVPVGKADGAGVGINDGLCEGTGVVGNAEGLEVGTTVG